MSEEESPPAPSDLEELPPRQCSVIFGVGGSQHEGLIKAEEQKSSLKSGLNDAGAPSTNNNTAERKPCSSLRDVDLDEDDEAGNKTVDVPVARTSTIINEKFMVGGLHDVAKAVIRNSHDTVQIRKTIYSAAALDSEFWPTALMTFLLQIVIIVLYMENDFRPFTVEPLEGNGWEQFTLALGRFVSYFLIWTNAIADLQNAINLMFCTKGSDRILGAFQLIVVLMYPLAWVCAIQVSTDFKEALTATGILAMFLKLDETVSSILELGLLKREIGELVHTIQNPLPPGYRETIMNISQLLYTCITFIYVWVVTLDCYFLAIFLWAGFTLSFFRAFYIDMKAAKPKIIGSIKTLFGMDDDKDVDASDESERHPREMTL